MKRSFLIALLPALLLLAILPACNPSSSAKESTSKYLPDNRDIGGQDLQDYGLRKLLSSGEDGYNFTGFRWENRYRLFEYGTFLNPVLYVEYEDLSEDTKYLMEVSGREDAPPREKKRPRERILETRLILSRDFMKNRLDVSFNWINESDMDTRVTDFGYALGLNPSNVMVKFGGAIGLTNVSNDMFRLAVGYEF